MIQQQQQQQQQQRSVLLSYTNHILRWNMGFVRLLSISFIYLLFIFTFCIDFGGISLHIWTAGIVLGGRLGVGYGCSREEREILFFGSLSLKTSILNVILSLIM